MSAALAWNNHFVGAPLTTAFGGNTSSIAFDAAYPASNAPDPDPSRVARVNYTRSGSGTTFSVGFSFAPGSGDQKTMRVVAALNVRLPADVTQVNLMSSSWNFGSSAANAFIAANLVRIAGTTDRYNLYFVDSIDRTWGALQLVVFCPINTSGYIEIGHVWASPALVLPDGVDSDWSVKPFDPSEVARAPGGGFAAQQLPRRRRLRAPISERDYETMLGTPGNAAVLSLRQFGLEAGVSSPVIAIPRDSDLHALQALSVYGLCSDVREIGHQGGNYFATEVSVDEIR